MIFKDCVSLANLSKSFSRSTLTEALSNRRDLSDILLPFVEASSSNISRVKLSSFWPRV